MLALLPAAAPASEIVVRFKPGTTATERGDARRGAHAKLRETLLVRGAQVVAVPDRERAAALRALRRHPGVAYAEVNGVVRALQTPDDPRFDELWGLRNTGQLLHGVPGVPGADIDAFAGWAAGLGSRDVLVAIADTGVDHTHPDLTDNTWTNPGEAGGRATNGLDDDGNGVADDVRGYDFAEDDPDPEDVHSHGTHVAGTVGAVGGNGVGVTGVAQRVSLVAVKVLGDSGSGTDADVAQGFAYAGRIGAQVVNASLGGPGLSQVVEDAIAGAPNTLFVVAAGNDEADNDVAPTSPCAEPPENLICVAATDHADAAAAFTNYGATTVDLGAPGVSILSTVPGGEYSSYSGTSMASPHVAGAAALLAAAAPSETTLERRRRLLAAVEPVASLAGRTVTGGRLDLREALDLSPNPAPEARFAVAPELPVAGQRVLLDGSASTDEGEIEDYTWDLDGDGRYETPPSDGPLLEHVFPAAGQFEIGLRVFDDRGRGATTRRTVEVAPAAAGDPAPALAVDPMPPTARVRATLDASASTDDGAIVRYEWDLDGDWIYERDGGAAAALDHAFPAAGRTPVGVRVTDDDGEQAEARVVLQVRPAAPIVRLQASDETPLPGQRVWFDGRASNDPDGWIDSWYWDLDGDGWVRWPYNWDTTIRYLYPGPVDAGLYLYDNAWNRGHATKRIEVQEPVPLKPAGVPRVAERGGGAADGDGVVEPGEGVTVEQDVRNVGNAALTGLSGTFGGSLGWGHPAGPARWPDVAASATASPVVPTQLDTSSTEVCGAPFDLELEVTTDQGSAIVPVRIPTGSPGPARTVTPPYSFTVQPNTSMSTGGLLPFENGIKDIDIRIDSIRHPHVGDLDIGFNVGSDYTPITLMHRRGGDSDDLKDVVFDDEAPTSITEASPPFTGRYRPEEPLSRFDGVVPTHGFQINVSNYSTEHAAELDRYSVVAAPGTCEDGRDNAAPVLPRPRVHTPVVLGSRMTVDVEGAYDPDGRIVAYRWDVDEDNLFEVETTEPTLETLPYDLLRYDLTVAAVDDRGGVTEAKADYRAYTTHPPVPRVVMTPPEPEPGEPVRFDASGSTDPEGSRLRFRWEFYADGRPDGEAAGPVVERPFGESVAGVRLTVTDESGVVDWWTAGFRVSSDAPTGQPPPEPPPEPPIEEPPDWQPPADDEPSTDQPDDGASAGDAGLTAVPPEEGPGAASGALSPPLARLAAPPGAGPGAPQGTPALRLSVGAPLAASLRAMRRGLLVRAGCDAACSLRAELHVSAGVARRLGLPRPVVARASRRLRRAATARLHLAVRPALLRRLRDVRRVAIVVGATSPGRKPAFVSRRIPVR
jgi:subtilisin family serine protease